MRKKILKSEKGTAIVEFAIILPVLILLIFGMAEFSVLYYNKAVLTNPSREGARGGIVYNANLTTGAYEPLTCNGSGLTVETLVNNYLTNHLVTFGAATTASTVCHHGTGSPPSFGVCAASGDSLMITVTYGYTFLLPNLFAQFFPSNPFQLTAITTMRCE